MNRIIEAADLATMLDDLSTENQVANPKLYDNLCQVVMDE